MPQMLNNLAEIFLSSANAFDRTFTLQKSHLGYTRRVRAHSSVG